MHNSYTSCSGDVNLTYPHVNTGGAVNDTPGAAPAAAKIIYWTSGLHYNVAKYLDLTTISQSLAESGKLAAEHLIAQITDSTRPVENIFIQHKLIERKTT